jgi:hypothetical protein
MESEALKDHLYTREDVYMKRDVINTIEGDFNARENTSSMLGPENNASTSTY